RLSLGLTRTGREAQALDVGDARQEQQLDLTARPQRVARIDRQGPTSAVVVQGGPLETLVPRPDAPCIAQLHVPLETLLVHVLAELDDETAARGDLALA